MVAGLPKRLYFEAKTLSAKPADVEGRLVVDLGNAVAAFSTVKNGLGRIEFRPATGRCYHAEVTRPSSVTERTTSKNLLDVGIIEAGDDTPGVIHLAAADRTSAESRRAATWPTSAAPTRYR